MEIDAIQEMFYRSKEKYEVRYITYIGDGDCKTFRRIFNVKSYGEVIG